MAISFTLNLTPNQIEFLQALDLYADGITDIIGRVGGRDCFITWTRKLIRDGLVEHVVPGPGQRYAGGLGGPEVIKAYRITENGRTVLGLIESDVRAFLDRQQKYQDAKKGTKKKSA